VKINHDIHICNMEVCTAKGKELDETFLLILQNSIYQNFFYNSVKLHENSLQRKTGFWHHED
jgi:hypothetical protein